MFVVDEQGRTLFDLAMRHFDLATRYRSSGRACQLLIECYTSKLTQEHGRLTLHVILGATEYSLAIDDEVEPPENPLKIQLPLGKLTFQHFRTLLSTLDTELIRNRDASRKLPIHMACQNMARWKFWLCFWSMEPHTFARPTTRGHCRCTHCAAVVC